MPPRMSPEVETAILTSYNELRNAAEVARRLGITYSTVHGILKRERGVCLQCGTNVLLGSSHCTECKAKLAQRAKRIARERILQGLCRRCPAPIGPGSRVFCQRCHEAVLKTNAAYKARHRAAPRKVHGFAQTYDQRTATIRRNYGLAGVAVWQRDQGRCCMCGVEYGERSVHIHHLDGDHTHSTEDNMACLCQSCHRLAHLLTEHPDLTRALTWIRSAYGVPL